MLGLLLFVLKVLSDFENVYFRGDCVGVCGKRFLENYERHHHQTWLDDCLHQAIYIVLSV